MFRLKSIAQHYVSKRNILQKKTYFSKHVSNIIEDGIKVDEMKSLRSESAPDAKDRHASSQSPCQVRGSVLGPPATRDNRNGAASVGDPVAHKERDTSWDVFRFLAALMLNRTAIYCQARN